MLGLIALALSGRKVPCGYGVGCCKTTGRSNDLLGNDSKVNTVAKCLV